MINISEQFKTVFEPALLQELESKAEFMEIPAGETILSYGQTVRQNASKAEVKDMLSYQLSDTYKQQTIKMTEQQLALKDFQMREAIKSGNIRAEETLKQELKDAEKRIDSIATDTGKPFHLLPISHIENH